MKLSITSFCRILFIVFLNTAYSAWGAVVPDPMFQDHAVLQQGMCVPVWGKADSGEKVFVSYRTHKIETQAGPDGKWRVDLPKLEYGAPSELVIEGANKISLKDVVVGEIWLGSGQSNMWNSGYPDEDPRLKEAIAGGPYPEIRLYMVDADARSKGGTLRWKPAEGNDVRRYSALLFQFGLRLNKELKVPVGLILAAKGGTPSGAWLSEDALISNPECQKALEEHRKRYPKELKRFEEIEAKWKTASAEAVAQGKDPGKAPSPPPTPGQLRDGKAGYLYESYVRQVIPYALRGVLWDQGESGTGLGDFLDQLKVMPALFNGWRKDWGQPDLTFIFIEKPSGAGCAWDRANPDTCLSLPFENKLPEKVLGARASGWNVEINYIEIRRNNNVFMVIASDLCPPSGKGDVNTHPRNKTAFADRAVRVALAKVYRKDVLCSGPEFDSAALEGPGVRVRFKNAGAGLAWKHNDRLQGFSLAGADGIWRWAEARINGDSVIVSCLRLNS